MAPEIRLDATEGLFFKRELESIDNAVYEHVYPEHKARLLIPKQGGIADWQESYTYRIYDRTGHAAYVASMGNDLPRTDASGTEVNSLIKMYGAAYGWDFMEIKQAAALSRPLDSMKANSNRFAVEEKVDEILAIGDTKANLKGILTLSGVGSYTLADKAAGGKTWGTAAAPNATGEEVAMDIMGMASARVSATKGVFSQFTMTLPIAQYEYASTKRMGDGSDVTALQFALRTSPHISRIEPWFRCDTAGASSTPLIALFPSDARVVSAIVPMEWSPQAPQERNLEMVINAVSRCGGVVCRYLPAVAYALGS